MGNTEAWIELWHCFFPSRVTFKRDAKEKLSVGFTGVKRAPALPAPIWPTSSETVSSHLHKLCYLKWPCLAFHLLNLAYSPVCWTAVLDAVPSKAFGQLRAKRSCSECTECCWQRCKLFLSPRKKKFSSYQQVTKAGILFHIFFLVCAILFNISSSRNAHIFNHIFIWWPLC